MTDTTTTATFEVGRTYGMTWVTDHTMLTLYTVVGRTAKFITVEDANGQRTRVGIHTDDRGERAMPLGRYSMAPVLRATREIV